MSYLRNTQDKYKHSRNDRDKEGTVELKKRLSKGDGTTNHTSASYLLHKSQKMLGNFTREYSFSKERIKPTTNNESCEDEEEPMSQRVNTEIDLRRKLKRYEKFHDKISKLVDQLAPPGYVYKYGSDNELHNNWRFIKDLVEDYVSIKKKLK